MTIVALQLNAPVISQMQILISLLPFQNLRAYLKFQKVNEDVHRETKLPSKFPWIFHVKKPSFFRIPMFANNLTSQELVEFLFTRRRRVLTLQYLFYKSYSMFTRDNRLAFCICDLQVGLL